MEYIAVEFFVFIFGAVVRVLGPQRCCIIQGNRTLYDLELFSSRRYFYDFLLTVFVFLFFCLGFLNDCLDNRICIELVCRVDGFIFLRGIGFAQVDRGRHERAVLLQYLSGTVFIGIFQTILIQEQCDCCADTFLDAICHIKFCAAITFPVNSSSALLVGKCIDMHCIGYHKSRVEAQTEMADDLIFICFIFIFCNEIGRTGKCDLVNVFFYLVCGHSQTVICDRYLFVIRINDDLYLRLVICG